MANEVKLKLAIEGGKVVIDEIDGVSTRLNKLDGNARAAASGAGNLGTALGSLATLGTALAIIKMADSATTLHTALKLSTNSAYEATIAYGALYDIAQQSRVSFTELGQTYATISRAGKELGVSQDRLLTVTQAIGNAMTIGGGSAASMQAALVQLGQGLGSGVLRGEELNSILEQTPRLAKALADGMGVPIGQLRSLGEQGKLTSEMVISALEKSAPQLAKELSSATVTVGQAFTMLTNSTIKFVGEADSASGASGNLANALQSVSKAVDTVGSAIENNKASFGVIINSLAGVATVAGLTTVANGIRLVWAAVMAGGAANPVILGLMVLGGIGGAALALGKQFSESETIIKASVAGMKNEIAAIDAVTQDSNAHLTESEKIKNAVRRASLESDVKTYSQKLALMAGENKDNESFGKLESARLAAGLADQRITGAIALDEARKLGKLRTDIEQKSTEDATKIVMTFRQKIQDNPADLASLSTEMAQRLKANVTETLADLKSFDEKLAAPGKEAAKQRLADTIANYEIYQGIVSTGEKAALATIKAQKDAGYLSDLAYAEKERAIAANAATDMQALTELELDAVRTSGLSKKDRADTERKYVQELASLGEQQLSITEKYNNATLVIEAKLLNEKRAYRKAETDSIEKYFADQAALHHAELKAVDDKIISAKDETAAILMAAASNITLAEAIDQVAMARMLERQASFVPGSDGWNAEQAKIDKARELIGVLKDKTVAQNWVDTSKTIRDSLTDAFMASVDSGKSLFMSLRDSVVGMFKTLVLRPMIQATVGSAMGLGTGAAAAGESGGGNLLGMAGNLSSLYNTLSGGLNVSMQSGAALAGLAAKAGSQMVAGFAGGMVSTASMASASAAASAGGSAMAGVIAGSVMNGLAGYGISKGLSGGYSIDGLNVNAISGIASMIPGVGPIAGLIGAAVNRAFGHGATEVQAQGTRGTFASSGQFSGSNYTSYKQAGGWFTDDKNWTDTSAIDPKQLNAWSTAFSTLKVASAGMASTLGLATDQITAYSKTVDIAAGTTQEQMTAIFTGMADDMATATAPGLAALARVGETSSTTLTRLSSSLSTVNQWLGVLDHSLLAVSLTGGDLASSLADTFGGLDKLATASKAYYDGFWTDAERLSDTTVNVAKGLALVGVAMPDSKEAFRTVVSGLDLTTEAGRNTYAVMLALAPEFATVADAAAAAVKTLFDTLTKSADDLVKNLTTARTAVADAKTSILNPDPKTLEQLQTAVASARVNRPSDAGLTAAQSAKTTADTDLKNWQGALAEVQVFNATLVSDAQTKLDKAVDVYRANSVNVQAAIDAAGSIYSVTKEKWIELQAPMDAVTKADAGLYAAQKSAASETAAYTKAVTTATAAKAAADTAAQKALDDYTTALGVYATDASKAVTTLGKLREETVAYYQAQKALAEGMATSAKGLRDAAHTAQTGTLSSTQSLAQQKRDFALNYSMALAIDGTKNPALKTAYADKMTAALPALAESLKASYTSRSEWQAAVDALAAQSKAVADVLSSDSTHDYQTDSLGLLTTIDSALATMQSDAGIISAAVKAGADQASNGSAAIINAILGSKVVPNVTSWVPTTAAKTVALTAGEPAVAKLPGYDVGSNYIPFDHTARVHAGEEITPRPYVDQQRSARNETNELLSRLLESNRALERDNAEMRRELQAIAGSSNKTSRLIDRAMPDGNSLAISGSLDGGSL